MSPTLHDIRIGISTKSITAENSRLQALRSRTSQYDWEHSTIFIPLKRLNRPHQSVMLTYDPERKYSFKVSYRVRHVGSGSDITILRLQWTLKLFLRHEAISVQRLRLLKEFRVGGTEQSMKYCLRPKIYEWSLVQLHITQGSFLRWCFRNKMFLGSFGMHQGHKHCQASCDVMTQG
jgi:hypothetical protein